MSAAFALAQLRHLYQLMRDGQVKDTREAAEGLLGPAIRELELDGLPQKELAERAMAALKAAGQRYAPKAMFEQMVRAGLINWEGQVTTLFGGKAKPETEEDLELFSESKHCLCCRGTGWFRDDLSGGESYCDCPAGQRLKEFERPPSL